MNIPPKKPETVSAEMDMALHVLEERMRIVERKLRSIIKEEMRSDTDDMIEDVVRRAKAAEEKRNVGKKSD